MATILTIQGVRRRSAAQLWMPGLLFFILAAQFMAAVMLATSMAPGYDVFGGAISDLGTVAETAVLFNVSLVAVGVLNLIAGYLFYRSHRRMWILVVFALAALGASGAGLLPLDRSDVHGLFALAAFVCFNLEALACATLVMGAMRWVSAVAGIVGLAFVILMVIGDAGAPGVFGPIGHGGAERMIVFPVMFWLMAFGGYLMAPRPEDVPQPG